MTGLQVWLHPSSRTIFLSRDVTCYVSLTTKCHAADLVALTNRFAAAGRDVASNVSTTYTRRRFGGRHPLCGIGVTSRMERTSMPDEASARTADSRPEPGPLTRTSTLRTP